MSAKAPAKGHTVKHTATKHKAAAKHAPVKTKKPVTAKAKGVKVHTAAKPATGAKPAGFALDGLPVCVSEALAMSLRLAGGAVSDEDVLRLHLLAAGTETAPASILEGLEAAFRFGLAGYRPVFRAVAPRVSRAGLVLRIDQPGSHAVLATPDGWWSWGELWSPWRARVCEAWAVSWP